MKDVFLIPANEIWYTTVDGKPIELSVYTTEQTVSNTYKEGKGVIVFEEPIVEIRLSAFNDCTSLQKVVIPSSVTEIGWYAVRG